MQQRQKPTSNVVSMAEEGKTIKVEDLATKVIAI